MRIALFASADYVFTFQVWRRLIHTLNPSDSVALVALFPDRLGRHCGRAIPSYYVRVLGPSAFARLAARSLRRRLALALGPAPRTYAALARAAGARLVSMASPNDPAAATLVRELDIDIIINATGFVYRGAILHAPRVAAINKHSSLLPHYRGILPVVWTLLEGRVPIAMTIHTMTSAIDAGSVLARETYPELRAEESVFTIYEKLHQREPELLVRALDVLRERGTTGLEVLDPSVGSYRSLPNRAHIAALRRRGTTFA